MDPLDELLESLVEEQQQKGTNDFADDLEAFAEAAAEAAVGGESIDGESGSFEGDIWSASTTAPMSLEERGTQRRKVRDIQRLMQVFLKAGKTLRLYSEGHRFFSNFSEEFMTRLEEQFEDMESLTLEITPVSINWDGHVIFENKEQRKNLAFKLYRDGVRLLQFRRGATTEEVRQFVALIAREVDSSALMGKDLSVLFWEADFKHIHLAVAETFVEYTAEAEKVLREIQTDIAELQGAFSVDGIGLSDLAHSPEAFTGTTLFDPESFRAPAPWDAERHEPEAYDDGEDDEDVSSPWAPESAVMDAVEDDEEGPIQPRLPEEAADEDRMQAIFEELFGLQDPYATFEEVGHVLAEVVVGETEPQELQTFLRHLDEALSPLLATAAIGPLNSLLRRLSLLGQAARRDEHFAGELLRDFFVHFCQHERMELLARAIDHDWDDSWAGEVFTFISLQDPSSIEELLGFLAMLHRLEARRVVTDALILLSEKNSGPFRGALQSLNWRLAADAVHALGKIGDPTSLDMMMGAFARDEPTLRVEILQALRPYQSPRIQDLVIAALHDSHEEVRLAALRYAAVYRIKEAIAEITAVVAARDFGSRTFDERRGWFITLGHIAGSSVFNAFRRKAEPSRGTADVNETVHLALLGIRSIRTSEASDWLSSFEKQAQGDLQLLTRKLMQQRKSS